MRVHNPPHPGEILADTVLREDASMSPTEFAKRLKVSRVVNACAVSVELAIRRAVALGGSAESWLHMQSTCDLWQAKKKKRPKIQPTHGRAA